LEKRSRHLERWQSHRWEEAWPRARELRIDPALFADAAPEQGEKLSVCCIETDS
jgi:hypothetical protein